MRVRDPKLMLDDGNHTEWVLGVTAQLMQCLMDDIMTAANPDPLAFKVLKGFVAVHTPKTLVSTIQGAANPVALFKAIADAYAPSATVHVSTLHEQLTNLRQGVAEPVRKYVERAQRLHTDLAAAGDPVTERYVVSQLLLRVRAEFEHTVDTMRQLGVAVVPLQFAAVASRLADTERTLVARGRIVYPAGDALPHTGLASVGELGFRLEGEDADRLEGEAAYTVAGPSGKRRRVPESPRVAGRQGGAQMRVGRALQLPAGWENLSAEQLHTILQRAKQQLGRGGNAPARGAAGGAVQCHRCKGWGHFQRDCATAPSFTLPPAAAHMPSQPAAAHVAVNTLQLAPLSDVFAPETDAGVAAAALVSLAQAADHTF